MWLALAGPTQRFSNCCTGCLRKWRSGWNKSRISRCLRRSELCGTASVIVRSVEPVPSQVGLNVAIFAHDAPPCLCTQLAFLSRAEDGVVSYVVGGSYVAAFTGDFRNRPGPIRCGYCRREDRDHWRSPRAANSAFVG